MRNVAMHFGTKVKRYSVLNEPDYYLYYDEGSCDVKSADKFRKRFQKRMVMTFGEWRARGTLVKGTNLSLRVACQRYLRGIEYRKIFNASAKAIHSVNPGREVLAGETSARPGPGLVLPRHEVEQAQGRPRLRAPSLPVARPDAGQARPTATASATSRTSTSSSRCRST